MPRGDHVRMEACARRRGAMSARSRLKPWFSKAPTLRDLERAAQIHYGWDDWNKPLTSLLQKAESHFLSEQLQQFFYGASTRGGLVSNPIEPLSWSGPMCDPNWPASNRTFTPRASAEDLAFCTCGASPGEAFPVDSRLAWRHLAYCPHSSSSSRFPRGAR
jgi:hypothetical protein